MLGRLISTILILHVSVYIYIHKYIQELIELMFKKWGVRTAKLDSLYSFLLLNKSNQDWATPILLNLAMHGRICVTNPSMCMTYCNKVISHLENHSCTTNHDPLISIYSKLVSHLYFSKQLQLFLYR